MLDPDRCDGDRVDAGKLDALLKSVGTDDAALQAMLADLAKDNGLGNVDIVEDEVPEPPAEPITKPGDLWLLGEHRLLCGDSTKAEDVARVMNGRQASCVFTDPPYGVSIAAKNRTLNALPCAQWRWACSGSSETRIRQSSTTISSPWEQLEATLFAAFRECATSRDGRGLHALRLLAPGMWTEHDDDDDDDAKSGPEGAARSDLGKESADVQHGPAGL